MHKACIFSKSSEVQGETASQERAKEPPQRKERELARMRRRQGQFPKKPDHICGRLCCKEDTWKPEATTGGRKKTNCANGSRLLNVGKIRRD